MGFRLNQEKTKLLILKTKEEVLATANRLKGYGGTECERQEKEVRMNHIRAKVLGAEMRPFTWAVGEVMEKGPHKGLIRRVDGQHSSEVFLELSPEEWSAVRLPVVVLWEHNDCDTLRDLPNLFEQYNPPWSSRNSEDLVGAHVAIHEDLNVLKDRRVLDQVTKGMAWYAKKVIGLPKEKSRQFDLIHDNHDTHAFLLWCGSFLQKGKSKEMFHPAVVGAMRHTFDADEPDRCEFWKRVSLGGTTQNEEGTPEYKLAEFLANLTDQHPEWPRTVAKHFKGAKPTENQVFATCLNGFRASITGKRLGDIFDPAKGKNAKQIAAEYAPLEAVAA